MSCFEKMGITQCVSAGQCVCVCVCMLKSTCPLAGNTTRGVAGVRPKECVKLDEEESTQRTRTHDVNNIGQYCAYGGRVKLSVMQRLNHPPHSPEFIFGAQ